MHTWCCPTMNPNRVFEWNASMCWRVLSCRFPVTLRMVCRCRGICYTHGVTIFLASKRFRSCVLCLMYTTGGPNRENILLIKWRNSSGFLVRGGECFTSFCEVINNDKYVLSYLDWILVMVARNPNPLPEMLPTGARCRLTGHVWCAHTAHFFTSFSTSRLIPG